MRILQIGKFYAPVRGGMETVLRQMCEGLLARDHEVTVLVAGTDSVDREEWIGDARGGKRGRLIRAASLAVVNSQPVVPSLPVLLRRCLATYRPDLVQLHWPHPAASLACWACLSRGRSGRVFPRLAIWYHADITRQRYGRWLLHPLMTANLRRADGIAVSSAGLREYSPLLRHWRDKVQIIPFGIDSEVWRCERSAAPADAEAPSECEFLFVGRLVYYKGLEPMLDALQLVPRARLVIVGDGPLRGRLAKRIRRNGLTDRVRLAGQLGDAELRALMGRACALLLPSVQASETFGVVQLEAMAAGLPVISSALPTGVAEVNLDGQTGRIVLPGDVRSLASAMEEILDQPECARAWGRAGRLHVRRHFSLERMLDELEAWYGNLLTGKTEAGLQRESDLQQDPDGPS
jgi:glycosyltransferase involved in cell wall biosynthesis